MLPTTLWVPLFIVLVYYLNFRYKPTIWFTELDLTPRHLLEEEEDAG